MTQVKRFARRVEKTTQRKKTSIGVAERIEVSIVAKSGGAVEKREKNSQGVCTRNTSQRMKRMKKRMKRKRNVKKQKLDLSNVACAAKRLGISLIAAQEIQTSKQKWNLKWIMREFSA